MLLMTHLHIIKMKFLLFACTIILINCDVIKINQTPFYSQWLGKDLTFDIESGIVTVQGIEDHASNMEVNQFFYQMTYQFGKAEGQLTDADSIILWLEGGPGVSSQMTLFSDSGSIRIDYNDKKDDFKMSIKQYGWNKDATMIYLDNPFGTGFSWSNSTNFITTTELAADYFAEFLAEFFKAHQELVKCRFYIFGESYGGHYVPVFAAKIFEDEKVKSIGLNFKGIAIGDGLVDLQDQVSLFKILKQLTFQSSFLYSIGAVDKFRRDYFQNEVNQAQQSMLEGNFAQGSLIFQDLYKGPIVEKYVSISPYNYQFLNDDNWRGDSPYTDFLNKYKNQFKVPSQIKFAPQNTTLFKQFTEDMGQSKSGKVLFLLDKVRVLLFNGQLDYIVNTGGALQWINKLEWSKISLWKKSEKKLFKYKEKVVGTVKKFENLCVVQIYAAGHTIADEQLEISQVMVDHFLNSDDIWE